MTKSDLAMITQRRRFSSPAATPQALSWHAFVDGLIYVLRGEEKPNEDWRIARLDPRQETPKVQDLAHVPFQCRSLTFDGVNFWTSHRAANEIVTFALPE